MTGGLQRLAEQDCDADVCGVEKVIGTIVLH
jgi:hypothetical protein